MFSMNRFALVVAFLFTGIPLVALSAGPGEPPGTLPEAAYNNQLGMQYFKHGYYDLIPKGRKAEAQENFAQAEKAFQKAISINGNFSEAHRNLARLYYLEQKFEEAVPHYTRIIQLNPEDLDSYVNLSLAYIELGDYEAAIRCLEDAKAQTQDKRIIRQLDSYIAKIKQAE